MYSELEMNIKRVGVAFDLIAKANTVSILSIGEMESVVNRALKGEFDHVLTDQSVGPDDRNLQAPG